MANAKLSISDHGEASTNAQGQYKFSYPIRKNVDPNLSISLFSEQHKMLKPLDGNIELDTSREEMFIELFVVNMSEQSEAFKKRISDLESRIARLKRKNEYTQRQLNAISNTLLDTILHFETLKRELESEISDLKNLTEEQKKQIDAQHDQIASLENKVAELSIQVEAAMEEQYHKKNQYFKDISANLISYVRTAKDLREHLPYIETYSNSRNFENYNKSIHKYDEQYEKFNDNYLDYLEGVKHYWEDKALLKKTEEIFDYLLKSIHFNQILKVTGDITNELANQKPKKAQKIATLAYEDWAINVSRLEKDVNRVLSELRKNL
ncbi:MAG: hypothetical protein SFU99_00190 [Saprospiraceae bacterium]|nr:hypothetical protein [Saprospiraceae bacterium]